MLGIPTVGFAYSSTQHNVELDVLCDWIEGSVLFLGEPLSASDVVDSLCENEIYSKQELAWEMVTNGWRELKRRIGWLGAGSPLTFAGRRLERTLDWKQSPAHAFCLCLSFARWFPNWSSQFGHDYTEQGALFETLTIESLKHHFPDWGIHATGWSKSRTDKLPQVVATVATLLGEPTGQIQRWTKASANEAGLDILCFHTFGDDRAGVQVLLVQCASGKHYEGKLHTPDLRVWKRIVEFTSDPSKAFSTPFALADAEFTRVVNLVNGMLLDRYRLLSPARSKADWLSAQLSNDIIAWLESRVAALPDDGQ